MPLFTRENAATLGKAGAIARWSKPKPEPIAAPLPASCPPLTATMADDFTARKLLRVRVQLERVESLLDKAVEPQAIDRFCAALSRLYEIERNLAGRPLPGSRRPKDHEPRAAQHGAWMVAEPMVAPAPVVQPALPVAEPMVAPAALPALPDAPPGGVTP